MGHVVHRCSKGFELVFFGFSWISDLWFYLIGFTWHKGYLLISHLCWRLNVNERYYCPVIHSWNKIFQCSMNFSITETHMGRHYLIDNVPTCCCATCPP